MSPLELRPPFVCEKFKVDEYLQNLKEGEAVMEIRCDPAHCRKKGKDLRRGSPVGRCRQLPLSNN